MNSDLHLDLGAIPFSRCGSYIAFSMFKDRSYTPDDVEDGLWLRCVHGDAANEVMRLELIEDGTAVPFDIQTTASTLTLQGVRGRVDICISDADTVRIRLSEATLRITARTFRNHGAIAEPDGCWVLNLAKSFRAYRLVPLQGDLTCDAPWTTKRCEHMIAELTASGDVCGEMAIEQLTWMRARQAHGEDFDTLTHEIRSEFAIFYKPFETCPAPLRKTAMRAAYLNWSSVVHAHRLLKRPAMYMSKNWMTNVWAWDHAFNALAVSLTDPDLAWDQLMVIFDHQDDSGQIPDFINDVRYLTTFVKPPIHGWILSRMIEFSGPFPPERLEEAYEKFSRWTDWWFTFRDPDGDGLPVYWHGNDSGWDNGTAFDVQLPLKSADLAAFLVIQMDVLANLADRLGRASESERWRKRANRTLTALIETLWNGRRFRSISTVTREPAALSDSIFSCLPIILGDRLPADIRQSLATEIQRHLTEWGTATEHPDSPRYEPDGYWRGPIWAPSTMILVDGLQAAGESKLAQDIAARFCRLCAQSGFAENFDALTGAPLRDPAYTWTSSVFLLLTNRYIVNSADI